MTSATLGYDGGAARSYEQAMGAVERDPGLLERTREAHRQFVAQRQPSAPAERAASSTVLAEHGARLDRAWERTQADRAAREREPNEGEERSR